MYLIAFYDLTTLYLQKNLLERYSIGFGDDNPAIVLVMAWFAWQYEC